MKKNSDAYDKALGDIACTLMTDKYLSTMQLWHALPRPKLSYGEMKRQLRFMVDAYLVERVGCAAGSQFYRWIG